jgi:hypothetical protein
MEPAAATHVLGLGAPAAYPVVMVVTGPPLISSGMPGGLDPAQQADLGHES